MERNSTMSNNLKDHSIGCRASTEDSNNYNHNRINDSWKCYSGNHGEDCRYGFSWPLRSYTCSFCKREFRSAQALGGHMNVHRRDRARLRESPPRDGKYPILNLNLNPDPNPNLSTSSSPSSPPTRLPPFTCTSLFLASSPFSSLSSPSSASPRQLKASGSFAEVEEFNGTNQEDEIKVLKKEEFVRLDLEIGLLSDLKEELDLELRLGYS